LEAHLVVKRKLVEEGKVEAMHGKIICAARRILLIIQRSCRWRRVLSLMCKHVRLQKD
jgi:hypothetical protein